MKIEPKGAKREPKGAKMKPKATKREPKGAKGSQQGDKREPRGAKRVPKGSQREPKASQREPKASQRTTKMDQISMPEKTWKRVRPTLRNGSILEPSLELKIFKSVVLSSISCFFLIFGKVEKTTVLERKGRAIFNFRGSQNPNFSRDCYRRVTCRYTYPMR